MMFLGILFVLYFVLGVVLSLILCYSVYLWMIAAPDGLHCDSVHLRRAIMMTDPFLFWFSLSLLLALCYPIAIISSSISNFKYNRSHP
jgi:hypothetical protein